MKLVVKENVFTVCDKRWKKGEDVFAIDEKQVKVASQVLSDIPSCTVKKTMELEPFSTKPFTCLNRRADFFEKQGIEAGSRVRVSPYLGDTLIFTPKFIRTLI